MGKSNNPAKRAAQEAELRAKKSRGNKAAGFMKFLLVLVLSLAILGPFFAGLATILPTNNTPVNMVTSPAPAPVITPTVVPAPVVSPTTATTAAPAGQ